MRLVLICDDYLPDSTRVSAKMMHELATELSFRGHEVVVLCPSKSQSEISTIDGIQVYKFKSGSIKDVSKFRRAINESLLSVKAWYVYRHYLKMNKIDGVVYYSPSIFFGFLVSLIKREWGCKSYLILRDSFPQWLIEHGVISANGLVAKYFRYFERVNYNAADYIGVMSEANKNIFLSKNARFNNVNVLYNWAKIEDLSDITTNCLIETLGLSKKVIFFYGGNIGHAQDMSNLIRLALNMRNVKDAHFLFIGQGDEVDLLNEFISCHGLTNCTYLPSISQDEYKSVLKSVHVGLFSLAKSHSVHNFPGKILGYMLNKLPVLGSVNMGNDLKSTINDANAGFIFDNGDDELLLNAAVRLTSDYKLRGEIGRNAFSLLESKFSVSSAVDTIQSSLFNESL